MHDIDFGWCYSKFFNKGKRRSGMADQDGIQDTQKYFVDVPMASEPFALRGSNSLDWGFKNRLSNIFRRETGKTVMLAIDHSTDVHERNRSEIQRGPQHSQGTFE